MTYAFTFDASACSGCKACQIACKDKNNLPTGVLWRRVYEVSGGSWQKQDETWATDVFAYNLSIACNHCVHPKCVGVCPTDAYVVRPDGIVYIDESKCMGCGYCAWACPYSAPRYNPELRHMTKCNFCYDNLDAGLSPACVAACPLRVLDFVTIDDGQWTTNGLSSIVHRPLWEIPGAEHPFPLPVFSRTQPHLALQPHAGMLNDLEKTVTNWEEIKAPVPNRLIGGSLSLGVQENPLVAFTLLVQMAAGMTVFSMFSPLTNLRLIAIGILLGLGGMFSFFHLGTKKNAWRALNHLNKSWLSREILMVGLFGLSWLALTAERWFLRSNFTLPVTALCGLGLVHAMGQVYRFKAAPTWNTWRTNAAFFLSAAVLGLTAIQFSGQTPWMWSLLGVLLAAEAWLTLSAWNSAHETVYRLRVGCIALGMLGLGCGLFVPESAWMWLSLPIFPLILLEEVTGRWLFYDETNRRCL